MVTRPLFGVYSRVHMVGIGGIGMEGLARILRAMGCWVSGTDRVASPVMDGLRRDGFDVGVGHDAARVGDAQLVVYSAAVPPDNCELTAARQRGLPVIARAELLGELTRLQPTIGVAGSHGKTTTCAMLVDILGQAGLSPSFLIGGWRQGRAQARLNQGELFVVEADEFCRSFLQLYPGWALVTNVDAEHLDCYGSLDAVEGAFAEYLDRLPFYGHAAVAGDGCVGSRVTEGRSRPVVTFGLAPGNRYRACAPQYRAWGSRFELRVHGECMGHVELGVPGQHNVRNALGAATMALSLGLPFAAVQRGLAGFTGVARRYESRGEHGGVLVVDDYAHHPAEVRAALGAARDSGRRVVAVFQPHLYSRTRDQCAGFAAALAEADQVFVTGIYGSREEPLPGVSAAGIVEAMGRRGHGRVELNADLEELPEQVARVCAEGDLVLIMGAGDIHRATAALIRRLDGPRK